MDDSVDVEGSSGRSKLGRTWLADAIRRVLSTRIGNEREHASWLSATLSIDRTGAWRKLNGRTPWSDADLMDVATGLNISLEDLFAAMVSKDDSAAVQDQGSEPYVSSDAERGTVLMAGVSKEVELVIGSACSPGGLHDIVAVCRDGAWVCISGAEAAESREPAFEVKRIRGWSEAPKMRIALLDDEPIVTAHAKELIATQGLHGECFETIGELQDAMQKTPFDAYVLDWLVCGKTSEELIRKVRQMEDGKHKPIVIVTGEITTGMVTEGDLTRVTQEYNCTTKEKPVRWRLFGAELKAALRPVEV